MDLKSALTAKGVNWSGEALISFPGEEAFDKATHRWNVYGAPTYTAAITPGNEEDVIESVKIAGSLKVPFLATGGRHGYNMTFGLLHGGLAIDLSQLSTVTVNHSANTVTVGGGAKFGDVLDMVYEAGFSIPSGSCSEVGMVGATIGGGVGVYQGLHGLVVDALISVRLITAEGLVVEASETSNSDLFWGIRGAGSNFGIITSATYKLEKIVNEGEIMIADLIFPGELKTSYFEALKSYEGNMPPELAIAAVIAYDANTNSTIVISVCVYNGPEDRGRQALAPLLGLCPPVAVVNNVPYNKVVPTMGFGIDAKNCQPGRIHSIYTANVRTISPQTLESVFDKMTAFYAKYPDARSSIIVIELFPNNAVLVVPNDKTAYHCRDAIALLMFQLEWTDEGSLTENAANALGRELRDDVAATSGYPELSVYVNYAHGDETLEQIYGKDKLPRLASLKKAWDPDNLFGFNHALPVQYP